jgi:hypothetical protein
MRGMKTARVCGLVLALGALMAFAGPGSATAFTGQIKGVVTDESAAPIEGITVCAEPVVPLVHTGCASPTDAEGKYTISGLQESNYLVHFFVEGRPALNYAQQWSPGQSSSEAATPVTVQEGATLEPIDAALAAGDQIAGVVTDAVGGQAIAGVDVCANRLGPFHSGEVGYCGHTDGEGRYRVGDLGIDEYAVSFRAGEGGPNYVAKNQPGTVSFTSPGEEAVGIDAALERGLGIEGQVTDAATGLPPQALNFTVVSVCAYAPVTEVAIGCTPVNPSTGDYSILGLPGGEYVVGFSVDTIEEGLDLHPDGYLRRYWDEVPDFAEATRLGVGDPPGSVITGIDARLIRGEEGHGLCGITSPCQGSGESPAAAVQAPLKSAAAPSPLRCKKGFRKVVRGGRARCVKIHKKRKDHHRNRQVHYR